MRSDCTKEVQLFWAGAKLVKGLRQGPQGGQAGVQGPADPGEVRGRLGQAVQEAG